MAGIEPSPPAELDVGGLWSNSVSDFGPLLALFGEQVARQFLSESMGWADNVIFAMAPLGIITAIVAAIRVAGPRWLKAIIGRARENRAIAEVELMSSTSHEVCELWNGQQLVRIMGAPPIRELLHIGSNYEKHTYRLFTLERAAKKKLLVKDGKLIRSDLPSRLTFYIEQTLLQQLRDPSRKGILPYQTGKITPGAIPGYN